MKISKETATKIAAQLLADKNKKVDLLHLEYRQAVTDAYKNQIPKEVNEFREKYPEYINTCTNLRLNGHGFNWETLSATEKVVQSINCSYNEVELNKTLADKFFKIKTKYEKARKEMKQLFEETEAALISLGTTKRIEENFPEAKPYLPIQNLMPVLNLNILRSKLNEI